MTKKHLIAGLYIFLIAPSFTQAKGVDFPSPFTLEKMRQHAAPLRSICVDIKHEICPKNAEKFSLHSTHRMKADIRKNLLYFESRYPSSGDPEIRQEIWIDENTITSLSFLSEKGKKRPPRIVARKSRQKIDFPESIREILTYNSAMPLSRRTHLLAPGIPMFIDKKIAMSNPIIRKEKHGDEDAILFSSSPGVVSERMHSVWIFSEKTGALLEKRDSVCENQNGGIKERILNKQVMSDFFSENGVLFPATIIFVSMDGSRARFTVDKETAKMNPLIDEKEFVPLIPGGTKVYDEINGIRYTTPIVGNPEAMKELEADLNAYFEDADNGKAKTAPKPETK